MPIGHTRLPQLLAPIREAVARALLHPGELFYSIVNHLIPLPIKNGFGIWEKLSGWISTYSNTEDVLVNMITFWAHGYTPRA